MATANPAGTPGNIPTPQAWSAEAEAQQHGGVHEDTLMPMYQVRSAAEAVVAAGTKKEGAGAKWMLLLLEMMAAGDAAETTTETQEG